MPKTPNKPAASAAAGDPRWMDLYRTGAVANLIVAALVIFAVVAFLIWPFKPGYTSTEAIFNSLQGNLFGALMSLDLPFLVIVALSIPSVLALYAALKRVNETYALIALVVALVAVAVLIPSRPVVEMVALSNKFAAATSAAEKSQYLAAGESLHAMFNGTAWMVYTLFITVSTVINSLLMLRSPLFGKLVGWLGIVIGIAGSLIFIPVSGPFIGLLATVGGVVWYILIARVLFRLARA